MSGQNLVHLTDVQGRINRGPNNVSTFIALILIVTSDDFRPISEESDNNSNSDSSPHSHQEGEWGGFEYNENDSLPLHMGDPFQEDLGILPYFSSRRT